MTATASIDGILFNVNPRSIRWNFNVKLASHKTIGGKVMQLYGWSMSDLVIEGQFGGDAVANQDIFYRQIKAIADKQVPQLGQSHPRPVRFLWPEHGWDFWVYVKQLTQTGASVAVETNERIHAPKYQLVLFVYQDNGDVIAVASNTAQAKYLARFSSGLGWSQSEWNGPQTSEALQEALQGNNVSDFMFSQYGLLDGIFPNAQDPNILSGGSGPGSNTGEG